MRLRKLYWFLFAGASALMLFALYSIFFQAPVELTMGIVQKIFYTHVPAAMCAYAGFTIASAASLAYLLKPRPGWDALAQTGVEIGLIFCLYVFVSGPLWAYKAWGKAWVWDPQLTATFVLFLLFGSAFLIRSFAGNSDRVKKIAAAVAIFAFIDIPIVHYAVRQWGGLHPTVEREGGGGLADDIAFTFRFSMLAVFALFLVLTWLASRIRARQLRVDRLYVEFEDLSRSLK